MNKKRIIQENNRIKELMNLFEDQNLGGVNELIYNPLGYGYDQGKYIPGYNVKKHDNHLHLGFDNRETAIEIMDKVKSMGLNCRENPYCGDEVDFVHADGSFHYKKFPGSPQVGGGVDVSGDVNKIKELVSWIESKYGGKTITPDSLSTDGSSGSTSTSASAPAPNLNVVSAIVKPFADALGVAESSNNEKKLILEKFVRPTDDSRNIDLDKKTVNFKTQVGRNVLSPYDGKIISVDSSSCSGNVVIGVDLDKEYHISLCGVDGTRKVSAGDRVSKGENIGVANKKEIEMKVSDKKGVKYKIAPFFEVEQKSTSKRNEYKGDAKGYDISKLHTSIMTAPLKALGKFVSGVYNNIGDQNKKAGMSESLKEELKIMKKLMK